SLDILEGRVNPVVIATYNSGVIRISLTESNDNATIEKTDVTGSGATTVTYSVTNGSGNVPIIGYTGNPTVSRIVVSDGSSGGSATGQKISFTSAMAETYGLSAGLSVTGIESVAIESAVNSVATNGISITGASTGITLGAGLTTTGGASIRLDGPVILSADVTLDTDSTPDGDIEFTSTINSDSTGGPFNLTVDAGSAMVTLAGNLGSTKSLDLISVTGGTISLNGNVTGDGDITFTGDTTLRHNTLVTSTGSGSEIKFAGNVLSDSASTPRSLTVGATAEAGAAIFTGALGSSSLKLGSVIINRVGTTTLTGDINTSNAPVSFAGAVELNANVTISTGTAKGSVTFRADLDSASTTPRNLTINAGSAAVSLKDVGTTDELGVTSITAGTINLEGDIKTTNGAITLAGAVIINSSLTISSTGGNITLNRSVNGSAINTRSLTLDSGNGGITVNSVVGNLRRLLGFTISDADDVTINNSVTATTISITADGGTDFMTTIFVTGNATLAGSTAITSTATVETYIDVSGRFNGSVSVTGSGPISELRATSNSNFTVTGTDVT
ncbi:MAG: beta strand repeat-containing protein, partial [Planctomycetota bacterium]